MTIHRITTIPAFIGLDTCYPTADQQTRARLHLDGAASPLAAKVAMETIQALLPHYSNSHSYVHNSAQISTQALSWAHKQILLTLGADHDEYTAIFLGSGTTAAINRIARGLAATRGNKKIVLVSAMEHHANDLPHRQFNNQVVYCPLTGTAANMGAIDLKKFAELCEKHSQQINYVALSSVSNVTGICNPIHELVEIAHQHGALVLVDGAQSVAHGPTTITDDNADFFVFSGHKVYTPMSPGVLIARKKLLHNLPGQDLGGGSVSTVSFYDYQLLSGYPDKEQSGTPNIAGAVALARVLQTLNKYEFTRIREHGQTLMNQLIDGLTSITKISVYGDLTYRRIGAVAFNHVNIDHGLLAAILNDYYAIAVRNECFCAHPYVSGLIKEELWELDLSNVPENQQAALINQKRGMVRASISLYNTAEDVERLINALLDIDLKIEDYRSHYQAQADGSYRHTTFTLDWQHELSFLTER